MCLHLHIGSLNPLFQESKEAKRPVESWAVVFQEGIFFQILKQFHGFL